MPERDLDVVVLGATSVTGRRVAAYLSERASEVGASWGAAGRNAAKVDRIVAEERAEAPETILAEVGDPDSLKALAARARVVLNLVGPYTRHGRPVINACVAEGAHYVDLNGEVPFVRRMICEFDERARGAGVKVVQVCGFESLPPDLAVQLAVERAAKGGETLAAVDVEIATERAPTPPRPSDLISGGTFQEPRRRLQRSGCPGSDGSGLSGRRSRPRYAGPRAQPDHSRAAGWSRRQRHRANVAGGVHQSAGAPAQLCAARRRGRELPRAVSLSRGACLRYAVAGALAAPQAGIARLAKASQATRSRRGGRWPASFPTRAAAVRPDRQRAPDHRRGAGRGTSRLPGDRPDEAWLLLAEDGATPPRSGCLTPALAIGTDGIDRFARAGLRF